MLDVIAIFIYSLSSYGLYHTIQVIRGTKLNFKPFNCRVCITFWYMVILMILGVIKTFITVFAVIGTIQLISVLEMILTRRVE